MSINSPACLERRAILTSMKPIAKAYFWFILVLDVLGYLTNFWYYRTNAGALLFMGMDVLLSAFVLYSFYRIVFGKKLIYRSFLKLFIPIFFLWEIAIFYFFQVRIQAIPPSVLMIVIAWIIYLPEYVTVAVGAYRRDEG